MEPKGLRIKLRERICSGSGKDLPFGLTRRADRDPLIPADIRAHSRLCPEE